MHQEKFEAGFTLLEILVAIAIFAIIMATIFGSFHSIFNTTEDLDKDIAAYEMAKSSLDRMILDLQSIHVSTPPEYRKPDMDDPPDPYRIKGETVLINQSYFPTLRFSGLAHISLEKGQRDGISEIIYYIQKRNDDSFVLRRSDRLYPYGTFTEKGSDPILCENVKSLTFVYYDQEGSEQESWDSDSDDFKYATPHAIGIKIEVGERQQSITLETAVNLPVFRKRLG
jgi:general secretion pathway protein J